MKFLACNFFVGDETFLGDDKTTARAMITRDLYQESSDSAKSLIVGSLSGSRLKSVRFLVGESGELVASGELMKIIKINH